MKFKLWLKKNTEFVPSNELDRRILKTSESDFEKIFSWEIPVGLVATLVMVIMIFNLAQIDPHNDERLIAQKESMELIQNFNDIELMADAGILTVNDWEKIK